MQVTLEKKQVSRNVLKQLHGVRQFVTIEYGYSVGVGGVMFKGRFMMSVVEVV